MKQDDIDKILASETEIAPSPTFLDSVMQAVEREATMTPPLQYPWVRALPGFLALLVAFAAVVGQGISILSDPATVATTHELLRQVSALAAAIGLQWIVLAIVLSVSSIALSSRWVDNNQPG